MQVINTNILQQAETESVQYTSFEDLVEAPPLEPLDGAADWKSQFLFIDNLRVQNKFKQFKMEDHWETVNSFCDSIRSNVQKNALMLLKENIQHQCCYDSRVLQKVFEKCESDFKFLKNEALLTVEMLGTKPYTHELAQSLSDITLNSNYKIQAHSYPTLVKVVLKSKFDCDWDPILKATFFVCEGKSIECRKATDQLYLALTKERPNLVDPEQFKVMIQRQKQKQPQRSFKEFKQQMKAQQQQNI